MPRRPARIATAVLTCLAVGFTSAGPVAAADLIPSTIWMSFFDAGQPLQDNHVITLIAYVSTTVDGLADNATVAFNEIDGDAPSCTITMNPATLTLCEIPDIAAGVYQYRATYSGNDTIAGSVSEPMELVIAADTVDAANVGRNYSTFYPYNDGYRDSLKIWGKRLEPISVSIKIYSSTGTRVRTASVARGTGSYAYRWNGRNSAGSILARGKYRIVQTLTDAAGTKQKYTHYATLSRKRLVTKTAYVTKAGSSVSAKGDSGTGSISISTTSGYAKLVGKSPGGWVGVGYQFTLPSAAVYKSISFQVYAKNLAGISYNEIGLQDFSKCPYSSTAPWSSGCFNRWKLMTYSAATTWFSRSGDVASNRSQRTVRGMVSVVHGTVYVYKARTKVVYGVLQ